MTRYYEITFTDGTTPHTIKYELLDHAAAHAWANMMSVCDVTALRPGHHPWRGVTPDWDSKYAEFTQLVSDLNTWIPEKIPDTWDDSQRQSSLNRYHIHFPKNWYGETDKERARQLDRYNVIIHEMETVLRDIKYGNKLHLLALPDGGNWSKYALQTDDFQYFIQSRRFGDLLAGYPHVGRNPIEIFASRDTAIPTEQILCQRDVATSHYMMFCDTHFNKELFDKFYVESGISWPYARDDARLALGFLKLGNLVTVDNHLSTKTESERNQICDIVRSCNTIDSWKII